MVKSFDTVNVPYGKCFVVEKGRAAESLADYVRRIRTEKGYSLADVSARSGGRIGKTYINRVENGLSSNPSPLKLRALSVGLGVPEEELFAVARGRVPANKDDADEQKLLFAFRDLDPGQKKSALRILEALRAGSDGLEREGTDGRRSKSRRRA